MIVLLAALLLVYVIFFDVHGDALRITSLDGEIYEDTLTWEDIDRMVYVDTTNQVSNNAFDDAVYYPSEYQQRDDIGITASQDQLLQAQNNEKQPLVVDTQVAAVPFAQESSIPDVVEDLQWRRFYSTDFLFGDTTSDPSVVNLGSQANPVWVNAGVSNTSVPQQQVVVTQPTAPVVPTSSTNTWAIQFANTWVWDGMITILQSLELDDDVQYILKDINNTHYVYLGNPNENIASLVSFLWGTSLDITDQFSIQNNQLFGSKITKITMPSYKRNLKELMIVTFANGDTWFLQIDKDWYNQLQNKISLKQTFEVYY